jgi:hypothetical protein
MMKKVLSHGVAQSYFAKGQRELSGFWYEIDEPLIGCKIRLDHWNPDAMTIIDYKTAKDVRPEPFKKAAYAMRYHVQAAWYRYGMAKLLNAPEDDISFLFVVQEKDPPHEVQVYQADDELITEGLIFCQEAVAILRDCVERDSWPGFLQDIRWLSLPGWVNRRNDIFE